MQIFISYRGRDRRGRHLIGLVLGSTIAFNLITWSVSFERVLVVTFIDKTGFYLIAGAALEGAGVGCDHHHADEPLALVAGDVSTRAGGPAA